MELSYFIFSFYFSHHNNLFFKKLKIFFQLGYLLFSICLFIYVYIIFLGPKIGPGFIFNEEELMIQVVAQKIIVALFTIAMLSQVMAFKKA